MLTLSFKKISVTGWTTSNARSVDFFSVYHKCVSMPGPSFTTDSE